MKVILKIFILLPALLFQQILNAQSGATVSLDTNAMLVGDQINMKLSFTAPAGSVIQWPVLNDTIISKIEILEKSKVDTAYSSDKSKMILQQVYKITCFDSGFYAIPPIVFNYKKPGDALTQKDESQAILLSVSSVNVNTAEDIRDIKKPLEAPYTLKEALPWIIGFILLAATAYLVFYYLKKRKKAEPVFRSPLKVKIPAHQIALDALENLRQKKLWQSGRIKDYHTELTDIIRDYIFAKFNIHAPELTSDEIITALNYTAADVGARQIIGQTFLVSDLVKFAKMQPLPAEHDTCLNNAIGFVKATMFQGQVTEPDHSDGSHFETKPDGYTGIEVPVVKLSEQATGDQGKEVKDV
jgi:hypothetical protein